MKSRSSYHLIATTTVVCLVLIAAAILRDGVSPEHLDDTAASSEIRHPAGTNSTDVREISDGSLEEVFAAICAPSNLPAILDAIPADPDSETTRFRERRQRLVGKLSVSPDVGHLHAAAMVEADPARALKLLDTAFKLDPNDAHLVWDATHLCSENVADSGCPLRRWESRLLALDGQNSEAWIRVAANRHRSGDAQGALRAMQQAAAAAESRIYWPESVELHERALASSGDYSFPERAAFGFGLAPLPRDQDYTTMCQEKSARDAEWAHACLAYGELTERQSKAYSNRSIGLSIQTIALRALGDDEQLAVVSAKQEKTKREYLEVTSSQSNLEEEALLMSPVLFYRYLEAVKAHGELAAQRQWRAEVQQWLNEHPEGDCISPPEY